MRQHRFLVALFGVALLLGGCPTTDDDTADDDDADDDTADDDTADDDTGDDDTADDDTGDDDTADDDTADDDTADDDTGDDDTTGDPDEDGDGYPLSEDCNDEDASVHPGAQEVCGNGVDDDCDPATLDLFDADADGDDCSVDCDDGDAAVGPSQVETCNGVDDDCDGYADDGVLGHSQTCPGHSCLAVLQSDPAAADGVFWIDPTGTAPVEAWCDIAGGGWTLVYRATNSGVAENAGTLTRDAIGTTPFTPTTMGENKLSDADVNALRTGSVVNDLKVVIHADQVLVGVSYHPSSCELISDQNLPLGHVCLDSTTTGPNATDYLSSGSSATLSRWYVDLNLGYHWTDTHIGPVPGGTPHSGPSTYCRYGAPPLCPVESSFEVWGL